MDFMVIHSSRPVSIVPGWFLCFFSSRFQVGLSWFQVGFLVIQGFSLVVHGFMLVFIFFKVPGRFFMVPGQFSWFFKIPGWFLMVQGSFSWIFYGSRSGFHDSRWILPSLMVPGWFKSELSAGGAKWDVENTPKGTRLICNLAPRFC